MITVNINISGLHLLTESLKELAYNKDRVVRSVATTMRAEVAYRIHTEGLDAKGNLIGPAGYSEKYLEYRVEKLNRLPDKKVIFSATGQMENDFQVVDTPEGYGLGFLDEFNYNKSKWLEEQFDTVVYGLSDNELALAEKTAQEETDRFIDATPQ